MSSARSSTPVGKAAAEKSTANTSPDGSDSGYGSTGNTTDSSMTDHSQVFADGVALPSRRFYEPKVKKLRPFDREIPQLIQHRFHDLHELFERPLCDYLIKAKVHPNPISIKLKVLGESEATAKPWIVVLCNKTASKKIQQFFNQHHIKAEYKPSNPESVLPSFELFVWNRPPRPMAGTEIYGNPDERATMCGRIIKVGEAHQSRSATLGGVIKVVKFVKHTGIVMLYGMTAGHVLTQQPPGQDNFDPVDICDDKDEEDEGFYSGEEDYEQEYELDASFEDDEEVQTLTNTGDKSRTNSQSPHLGRLWPRIGHASATSNEGIGTEHDLDWALIEFDRPADCRPNLLVSFDHEEQAAKTRPLKENGKFTEDGSHRPVLLLSGTGGAKSGTLSTSLSFLMMGPAKAFTKTYTLVLPHGSVLNAGDCGSWVVDASTCEVYGHVVASDAMGDSYVVPLGATLRDMEEKLEAAVSLPTEADIETWLAQPAKAAAEDVAVSARSKKKKVAFNDFKTHRAESPKDLVELAGKPWSQASASLTSSATQTSTIVVDYCNLCNERFEGTPQNVRSDLLRHVQTSSRHKKDATIGTENPVSQDAKDARDGRSRKASPQYSTNVQQKTTDSAAMQQPSPVPWSIRSVYSSLRNRSKSDSQQKDGDKGNSVGNLNKKPAGSASAKKPPAAALPTSIAKELKNTTKKSKSKKDLASPPLGKRLPAPSSAPVGRISKDLHPGTPAMPVIPDHQLSPPVNTPLSPRFRQGAKLATPPSRPAPPLVHGHENFPGSNLDPHHLSHNSSPGQVSYEGYTFTKCDPKQIGQKATWAVASMSPMPVSQQDLKDHIKRNRNKHMSALDDYDEKLKGFKRKQVENLIRERTKIDGDYGYEYVLASIKLDSRKSRKRFTETVSMQVILKRQLIAGFLHEPSTGPPSMVFHPKLPSQVMDLTSKDEPGKVRESSGGSQGVGHEVTMVSFAGRPEPGASPVPPWYAQPFSHRVQNLDDRRPSFPVEPQPPLFHGPFDYLNSPGQGMRQPPHPHSVPLVPPTYNTQAPIEITDKSKQEKEGFPKISRPKFEPRKKRDYPSDSPLSDLSPDLDSDNSWTKTDATPDTVLSGESREYRKEKKSDKASKESSYDKDSVERRPYAHEREGPVSIHHHRKEGHRHYSPSPAHRSSDDLGLNLEHHGGRANSPQYPYGHIYRHHGFHEVEPGISFPADHTSRGRQNSVSPQRPSHRRTLSYNLDRPLAPDSRALVPTHRRPIVYRETTGDSSRPVDIYDHRAERGRELERLERVRLRFEREKDGAEARAAEREIRRFKEHEMKDRREREVIEMHRAERARELERLERVRLRFEREEDGAEARAAEREIRMLKDYEIMREIDRRERESIARQRSQRETTFDDRRYMPRDRRDPGYYY